jgi:protein transport protein SEC23
MDFSEHENLNGCRFSWNIWPSTRADATKAVVPIAALYTPLKKTNGFEIVEYDPVQCRSRDCGGVLNPYCMIDFRSKSWACPFCRQRNPFPPHYADYMTEQNLPGELIATNTTMEYQLPNPVVSPPAFLLVLDTSLIDAEMEQMKDSVLQAITMMPPNALVGLVTFGTMCYVHELGFSDMPKSYAFRGNKEVSSAQVATQLGITSRLGAGQQASTAATSARRFLLPVSECEYILSTILEDLQKDSWPIPSGNRAGRCTGVAVSVAVGLLEATYAQNSARVVVLTGGPATVGPGMVVGKPLSESIRSFSDMAKDQQNARYVKPAMKYYTQLAMRAVAAGHAVDIFACNLDQFGLYEMKVLSEKTGGAIVMSDSFSMHVFKNSFKRLFELDPAGYLNMGFHAKIDCLTSPDLKICGAIGNCSSVNKKSAAVSDTVIGEGGTSQWTMGAIDSRSTIAFYFEPSTSTAQPNNPNAARQGYIQFQTLYNHPSGKKRLRVTTVSARFADSNLNGMNAGFDQEAAAVIMARYAVNKAESGTDDPLDVLRWVDRMLIRLISKFADFRKDDPQSFHLSPEFTIYPQFMYHLRRSPFLNSSNMSPDESSYYRTHLLREATVNSLVMIQPALTEYSFEGYGRPVLLDAVSLKPNVILLLDSFFYVVIWRGETIQAWHDAGYQEKEEYASFKQLLMEPETDARNILLERFPVPKFVVTSTGGSQERFLKSKVNPSVTYNTDIGGGTGQAVITDDVSLKVFMEHLIRLAVMG